MSLDSMGKKLFDLTDWNSGVNKVRNYITGDRATDMLNERQNRRQEQTYYRERAYDFRLNQLAEQNSATNQVQGAQNAGFSPVSFGGVPNANVAAGSTSQPTGGNAKSSGKMSMISELLGLKQQSANLDAMKAQTENTEQNTEKAKAETHNLELQNASTDDTFSAGHQAVVSKLGSIQIDPNASDEVKDFAAHLQTALEDKKYARVGDVIESINAGVKASEMSWQEVRYRNH